MVKFSQYFGLEEMKQSDLDFLDGLIHKDILLYIDPALIEVHDGEWFQESRRIITSFFDTVFSLYKDGKTEDADSLLGNGREPNETRLGVSSGNPRGKGTSSEKLIEVFHHIIDQKLLKDNLISNYTDLNIFVKDFAEDRMSDLVTNIIREKLADYTIQQAEIYGLPLTEKQVEIGVGWDSEKLRWKKVTKQALMIDGSLLLLIPKTILVQKYLYTVEEYLTKVVFDWRKKYHLENDTNLVRKKYVKKHDKIVSYEPSNEVLIEEEINKRGLTRKEYVINITREKRELIDKFRSKIEHTYRGTKNNSLSDDELTRIVETRSKE